MLALLADLGDPQHGRPRIHIAGSKGKGSTGAMIEAVLGAAERRTGYYIVRQPTHVPDGPSSRGG